MKIYCTILSWLIAVLLFLFLLTNYNYKQEKRKLQKCQKEKLEIQKQFKSHMKKCAFISTNAIQKWDGRYVTLYAPQHTTRKRKNYTKQMSKYSFKN